MPKVNIVPVQQSIEPIPDNLVKIVFSDEEERKAIQNMMEMAQDKDKRGRHTVLAFEVLHRMKHGTQGQQNANTIHFTITGFDTSKKVEAPFTKEK